MAKRKNWIQKTKIKKGALRDKVKRIYGKTGFDEKGRIKLLILNSLAHHSTNEKTRRQAQLALNFRKMKKRGRKR